MLPPLLPGFQAQYPRVELTLLNGNSEHIADALLRGQIDLGFVEGQIKNRDLHYDLLLDDELVAVRRAQARNLPPAPLTLAAALRHPLVLRERGSGTLLEVLEYALRAHKIKLSDLSVRFYLDTTEGIKSYLEATPDCLGFVSRRALTKELAAGRLEIVPVENLYLRRRFEVVWVQGQPLSAQAQRFLTYTHRRTSAAHNV